VVTSTAADFSQAELPLQDASADYEAEDKAILSHSKLWKNFDPESGKDC
jgi:hypothetical protein